MDEQEVERERNTETVVELDPERERDLLAGTAREVDDAATDADALERFADQLEGYRRNAEREEAWIRELRLPGEGRPNAGDDIEIEFLLPSGDSFTRTFTVPPQTWPTDSRLVRLLDHVGRTPATLTDILGDAVMTVHDGDQWQLSLEDAPPDTNEGSNDQWDERWGITLLLGTVIPLIVVAQIVSPLAFFVGGSAVATVFVHLLGGVALLVTLSYVFASFVSRFADTRGRLQV